MFDDGISVLLAMLCAAAIGAGGWLVAHSTVATECERLGSFYVGNKVFICEVKK